jgi:hypothetical protein
MRAEPQTDRPIRMLAAVNDARGNDRRHKWLHMPRIRQRVVALTRAKIGKIPRVVIRVRL